MAKSKRWSREDLDSTFEEFLKTPLSSKDDTDKIKKLLDKPVKNVKDVTSSSLWWANDSDDESLKKSKSKSFIKAKKPESPGRSKTSSDSKTPTKGSHHSFSSTKDKVGSSGRSAGKQPSSPRRSGRRDPQKSKRQVSPNKVRGSKSNASMSKDSLEDISEKSEEHDHHYHSERRGNANHDNPVISIHDSSIDTSASYEGAQAARSRDNPLGFDTLDEMADKQNFFQNLEKGSEGTVDYSRLNHDLSQTGGTTLMSPAARMARADTSGISGSPADTSTPARPRTGEKEDPSGQKPSMLSRVALMDSLESTFNTDASPKITNSREGTLPDTLKTGIMGTNTSREMEDLQRVLQEAELSPTIYGGDSRPTTAKTGLEVAADRGGKGEGDHNQNNGTSAGPPLASWKPDRSVGDIFREMDAIEKRGRDIENGDDDIQLRSDYKSPRGAHSSNNHHHVNSDDSFDGPHLDRSEDFQPVTAVTVKDKHKKESRKEPTDISLTVSTATAEKVPTARDRYAHVQSSGYGQLSSPRVKRSRSAGVQRSLSRGQSREDSSPRRNDHRATAGKSSPPKGVSPRVPLKDRAKSATTSSIANSPSAFQKMLNKSDAASSPERNFLMQSMEAVLDSYLKEHQSSTPSPIKDAGRDQESALLDEVKDLRIQLITERNSKIKLQEEIFAQEEKLKNQLEAQKFKYEEEVFSLKQENFVLVAKLKEYEGDKETKTKPSAGSGEPVESSESSVGRLEREIQEQETLLAGYQAENKRLYEEIKGFKKQAKATEGSMFKENQRLTAELTNLRQELDMKTNELQNKGVITSMAVQQQIAAGNAEAMMGASRVAHLEGELSEAKRVQENHARELRQMQQAVWEQERVMEGLVKEKESLSKLLSESLTPQQVKDLEAQHKNEIEKHLKKLRWYAENQELLDKSSAKLRAKDEEIHRLKLKLEDFKSEAGRKLEENKIRNKEKAADSKRIQDLERQVKEMEQVIRRRHPNSLPAMMMVAAQVPDSVLLDGGAGGLNTTTGGRSVQVLEARVKKLEAELESKDEAACADLRAMEQKYNHVKLQFEERISDLEQQLSIYRGLDPNPDLSASLGHVRGQQARPHSHTLALERELDNVKDRARKQVAESQAHVDKLTAELNKMKKNQENLVRNEARQNEREWKSEISKLQQQVQEREQDIQLLHRTVEKLRSKAGKKGADSEAWPPYPHAPPSSSKEYNSSNFTDSQTSVALEENQRLQAKVEQLQLELDQQRVDLRRSLAETESVARQTQEGLQNQIETIKSSHQQELQRMIANQALHSSSSRVSELQNKCDTQEVMVTHLKSQLKTASIDLEEMSKVKAKEAELKAQVDDLQSKLHDARLSQTPEMRHFESLEDKLSSLVQRQKRREEELNTVVRGSQVMLGRAELEEEVDKWKRQVEQKNLQLQSFRAELDSILEVLKTLQRQGVTLPIGPLYS